MAQPLSSGPNRHSTKATGKDRPVHDASIAPVIRDGESSSVRTSRTNDKGLVIVSATRQPEVIADPEEEFLSKARERFARVVSSENDWRRDAKEELDFTDGLKHWDETMRAERTGRPCLTFDRITPAVKQVVNEARQSPPEPEVAPVGGGADKETAQVIQGLFRNIDNDSGSDTVFMTAYEHACKIGRGWWRILFDWETDDPTSQEAFLQKLMLKRIPNPFSIYVDPACLEFDYSDMDFLFHTEDIDRDTFKELYGEDAERTLEYFGAGVTFEATGDRIRSDWFPNGAIRVAEYWYKERTKRTIHLLEGGRVVEDAELYDATPVATRELFETKIFCCKMTGGDVIRRWEWPGKWIPFVPVIGDEIWKNGKRTVRGMIRPAMDANLSYDFMRSKQAESIALAPISPVMAAIGSLGQFESMWADANRKAYAVLPYLTEVNGKPVPPPQRLNTADAQVQAITLAIAHAENDIEAMTQTYKPDLGAPQAEASGRAILARQREGDNAHFNYHDNLARSIRRTGLIELDLIPVVYSEERAITIFDPDQSVRSVTINAMTLHKGAQRIFDLAQTHGAARYDVVMKSGPSYATRRQEGAAALMDLIKFIPGPMSRALDLLVGYLDIPDQDALAARLRPADIPTDDGPTIQQLTQQNHQMQQLIQQLTQSVNALSDKTAAERLKLASQERTAIHGDFAGILEALIKAKSSGAEALLSEVAETLRQREAQLAASQETANPDAAGSQPQGQPAAQPQAAPGPAAPSASS
jgi:hypothetical protein